MPANSIRSAWAYRGFIAGSVKREFQARYRNSLLGAAWAILQPLAMITVYTVIFTQVMRARLPGNDSSFAYSIYLCAGILTWGLFAEIVSRSQNIFIENSNLLKKINFPIICLPIITIASSLLNFTIIFSLYITFLIISGNFPGIVFIGIIPILTLQVIFAIGLGTSLGILNVFFRDIGHFFSIFLQLWFWLTPIVYPSNILPDYAQAVISLNPMAAIVNAHHHILVNATWPDWHTLLPASIISIASCLLSVHLFKKHNAEIVDEI